MSLTTPLSKFFKDNTELGKWLMEVLLENAPNLIIPPEWLEDRPRKKLRSEEDCHTLKYHQYMTQTTWGRLLTHPDLYTEGSEEWNTFKGRFRMTPPMFKKFVRFCKAKSIFAQIYDTKKIPFEFKIMADMELRHR